MEYCRLDIGIYFFQKVDVGQGPLKPGDSAVIFSRAMDLKCAKGEPSNAFINIIIIIFAIIIIITRPKPAYGLQGLAGSWGQVTDQADVFNHEKPTWNLENP